jgi:hypothetical protein
MWRSFLALLLVTLLGGCSMSMSPTYQSLPVSPTPKVKVTHTPKPISEITLPASTPDPTCLPPCFYGIIPGKTTLTETAALLGVPSPDHEALLWETKASRRSWYAPSQYLANHIWFQDEIVRSIVIREQRDVTFQEVVNRYGEPEVTAIGNPDAMYMGDLFLLYPSKGMAFMGRFRSDQDGAVWYTPMPDVFVDSEIYFPPMPAASLTAKIVQQWNASGTILGIFPWRGFRHSVR